MRLVVKALFYGISAGNVHDVEVHEQIRTSARRPSGVVDTSRPDERWDEDRHWQSAFGPGLSSPIWLLGDRYTMLPFFPHRVRMRVQ